MFSTLILSIALAFVAVVQTLSSVHCRSLECIRTVDNITAPPNTPECIRPPKTPKQTIHKQPTLTVPTLARVGAPLRGVPNCEPFVQRTDGLEMLNVSPSHSIM
jgi:hypothetical protein